MSHFHERLAALSAARSSTNLTGIRRGIEKESLRVTPDGFLAQTPHNPALGSALTHPQITTDYSEALLEFITPADTGVNEMLATLENIHRYTYANLDDELLWVNSMPCVLKGDAQIPVAQYGNSNVGQMKTIYRLGLGHRYGRLMQAIAGIHYNFSLSDTFWEFFREQQESSLSLQDFKTESYFAMIRNFRRYFWLLLYLFGAAPAVCRTFVAGREHSLLPFNGDETTLHSPYATSLRMGDLGYQSKAQQSILVNYNDLQSYINALCAAITQHYSPYAEIGLKNSDGKYQQLNDGILQIENEFYSTIRPKRTTKTGETALYALFDRGVEYIEVRCLDLNPYLPLGIDSEQIHFLDTFLLYCLLKDSPPATAEEYQHVQENQQRIVYRGRDPKLELLNAERSHPFSQWGGQLMDDLTEVARLLDESYVTHVHSQSVTRQRDKINDASLTPSAQVLHDMKEQQSSFYEFAMQKTIEHHQHFCDWPLDANTLETYSNMAKESLAAQKTIEANDTLSFEEYLKQFYSQYQCGCG